MHSPEIGQESRGTAKDTEVLLERFSSYLRGLCKAEGTIKQYASDVKGWAAWWGKPVQHFDLAAYDAWGAWQAESGFSGRTIRMHQMGVRRFFRWLRRGKLILESPCEKESGAESVEIADRYPEVLTLEEVAVFRAIPRSPRTKALFALLYDCGLRNSEARTLPLSHVREDHLKVIGKKNRERKVPILPVTKAILDNWIAHRHKGSEWLFPTPAGNPFGMEAMCNLVKKWVRISGIQRRVTAHTFRHSIATHLSEAGMDIEVIQEMLGHKSIETTRIYVHVAQTRLRASVLMHHPMAGKGYPSDFEPKDRSNSSNGSKNG